MARLSYLKNVVTLELQSEKCVGCGMCLSVCPHAVFGLMNGGVEIKDRDACMECGACARNCPMGAVSVQSGVGCATAVINSALGRKACCTIDSRDQEGAAAGCGPTDRDAGCC